MTLAIVYSRALCGMDAPEVAVEVHLSMGLPSFTLVGLPDTEVKESRERVRAAIIQSGFDFPARRIVVNLAPAELPKDSGRFDLPIAIALLAASGQIPLAQLEQYEFAGELALTGGLRAVRGALPMALQTRKVGRTFILPQESAQQAALLEDAPILAASTLAEVCAHLHGLAPLNAPQKVTLQTAVHPLDMQDVKGQAMARLALEIAASGAHSLLMQGPPGTGKSMLAARLPGILPPMTEEESVLSAAVTSLGVSGFNLKDWGLRPYRSPHHSASAAALVGGGTDPKPGEISLAHLGVLFLDELPEFDRKVLENLREPLESGQVQISRVARQVTYPAKFQLVAAMNPCPCGYQGHPIRKCYCSPDAVARYRGRISGPLLDRIDLFCDVQTLTAQELQTLGAGEDSASVKARVLATRARQLARQGKYNAWLEGAEIDRYCDPKPAAKAILTAAIDKLGLSARAYHRILKVARTLADRDLCDTVGRNHVLSALQFRRSLGDKMA
jgi:magnesium chelatase family protein